MHLHTCRRVCLPLHVSCLWTEMSRGPKITLSLSCGDAGACSAGLMDHAAHRPKMRVCVSVTACVRARERHCVCNPVLLALSWCFADPQRPPTISGIKTGGKKKKEEAWNIILGSSRSESAARQIFVCSCSEQENVSLCEGVWIVFVFSRFPIWRDDYTAIAHRMCFDMAN